MKRTVAALLLAGIAGCDATSGIGLQLPDGDAVAGQTAFEGLRCNACHEMAGRNMAFVGAGTPVPLGGPTTRVRTYGELVTSIVNPSHRLAPSYAEIQGAAGGASPMASAALNEVMTVQQLIDLVAFLQSAYEIIETPRPMPWRVYPETDFGRHTIEPVER